MRRNRGHEIQIDADYIGALLFESGTVDPEKLIPEENEWENLPQAPPPVSGYRPADVAGLACWNCGHYTIVGDPDNDDDIDGICNLFESQADATYTCDKFTAHADLNRQGPHTSWPEDKADAAMQKARYGSIAEMDYSDSTVMNTINFSASEATEEEGLIWKDILRTGVWDQTPTVNGVIDRKLQILRNGESDPAKGIFSLAELETNFNDGAVPYVTLPLSDDLNDHKNIARVNTGFVRKLRIIDRGNTSFLQAGCDFTEPDIREKVLRGTIPDVSAGIPVGVTRRGENKKFFRTVLDHVCLTRKPFVDKLMPFGIAAADSEELPVEAWEAGVESTETEPNKPDSETPPSSTSENVLSFRQQQSVIRNALTNQLRLGPDYIVEDIEGTQAVISHRTSRSKWKVPFRLTGEESDPVVMAAVDKWKLIEESQTEPEQIAASNSRKSELEQAHELRELRLSQPTSTTGGIQMSVTKLDGVELSDLPEAARASIQKVLDENSSLNRKSRETDIEARIKELEDLGFSDRPGALKFYRQVMLDDDNGPAVVLFSDQPEDKRERVSAIGILDRFIDALKAGDAVQFSDQHLASGSDKKPPKDATGEKADLETRVEAAKTGLYGDKSKRRTGRK